MARQVQPTTRGRLQVWAGKARPAEGELTVSSNIQMRKYYETIRIRTS